MDKKVLNIVIAIIVIAIAVYAYMQLGNKKGGEDVNAPASQFDSVIDNPIEAMPETNPFDTNVNPMEGYKNPFE
jgi:flagellar basal body-associated protein FliL